MINTCLINSFIIMTISLYSSYAQDDDDSSEADPNVFNVETGKVAMKNILDFINQRAPLSGYENLKNEVDRAANYEGLANVAKDVGDVMSPDVLKKSADMGIVLPIFLVPTPPPDVNPVEGNTENP